MRVEWITMGLIVGTYALWFLAGLLLWPIAPLLALTVMCLLAGFHSSLVHECLHGHPTRKRWLNELLVSMNLSLVWPYRRFRTLHLRHHHDSHLTDPFEDPESYYKARWQVQRMSRVMRTLFRANNTMVGRVVLGPLLGAWGLIVGDAQRILSGDRRILSDWAFHVAGLFPVVFSIIWIFNIPFWQYLLVVWGSLSLISIRTFAEHRWFETVEGRTIIVERSPLSFLFLNNNLHIVHHTHPAAPWYELPRLFAEKRAFWVEFNKGYVFPNYWELFRTYGFRQKEWVDHPTLHTEPDLAFRLSYQADEPR